MAEGHADGGAGDMDAGYRGFLEESRRWQLTPVSVGEMKRWIERRRGDNETSAADVDIETDTAIGDTHELGSVRLTSGSLMLIDFGLLHLWSHEEPPHLDPSLVGDAVASRANAAIDFEITGPDRFDLAELLNLAAVKGSFVFDQSPDFVDELGERVRGLVESNSFDAELRQIDRMPHGVRAKALLEQAPDGAEIQFHGPWAVGVAGLPVGVDLPVRGELLPPDHSDSDRWRSVWVELGNRDDVFRSEHIGHVLVDEARLILCDLEMLGEWQVGESHDGLYDVAFWGRDAAEVADALGAGKIAQQGGSLSGWMDLSLEDAIARAEELQALNGGESDRRFVIDLRPHDHAYQLLSQAWISDTGAGTIELAGGIATGFFTSWGDGAFPVYREVAESGELLALRVDFDPEGRSPEDGEARTHAR